MTKDGRTDGRTDRQKDGQAENNRALPIFVGVALISIKNLGRRFDASKMHLSPPGGLGCCPF